MRVLVLHSDVPADAPPDEQETLNQARSVAAALEQKGHRAHVAAFRTDPVAMARAIAHDGADVVFNLVESIGGCGRYAPIGAAVLEGCGVKFTGSSASVLAACGNKTIAKAMLERAGIPTAPWATAPDWRGVEGAGRWIVKSADEDASIGLDDGAVVEGVSDVKARAAASVARYGGTWFAERFIAGREFHVSMLEGEGEPIALPISEMVFHNWEKGRPNILGYDAKWDTKTADYKNTRRSFEWNEEIAGLRETLQTIANKSWRMFGVRGWARVDFRVDDKGNPFVLEINCNASLDPSDCHPASAAAAGISYPDLIERIVMAANHD